ncbi:MAG: YihY/virulence factor BrkB family protein [Chloroflexi bacterium]|nr:YihY/virulence factor BrkB family protein [Chloroflexota bacterium]
MKRDTHLRIWLKAIQSTFRLNSILSAAGIPFFALFSLFPLILLVVAVAGSWFDPLWVESEIATQLEFVIPGLNQLLGENLERIVLARGSITGFASVSLIWSGSTLFSVLIRTLDLIWNGAPTRPGWHHRSLALSAVIGITIVILPLLFIITTTGPIIDRFIPELFARLYEQLTLFVSLIIGSLLFGLLYRYLPHTRPAWRYIWPGAISCSVLWELAKRGFLYYIAHFLSLSNLVYGSVTTIVVFLAWVYLSGLIFFLERI